MSYCVNCGVKLKKSEKKCPLCNTIVINPNKIKKEYEPVYSNKLENFKKINYKYVSHLLLLSLIIISLVIFICNYIINGHITWSIYVVLVIFYLSCHFQYIIQKNIYIAHIIELAGAEMFMYALAYLNNGMHWYLYLICPFLIIFWMYVILATYLLKNKKWNIFRRISICILFSSITLLAIESAIDLYLHGMISFSWSLYSSIPLIVISLIILIISFNKKLIEEIKQRIFI